MPKFGGRGRVVRHAQDQWTKKHEDVYRTVKKLSDFTTPGPTAIYLLLDEHENSINDSHFFPFNNLRIYDRRWLDAPAGRHGNAAGFKPVTLFVKERCPKF